jgi:hypothetical protein
VAGALAALSIVVAGAVTAAVVAPGRHPDPPDPVATTTPVSTAPGPGSTAGPGPPTVPPTDPLRAVVDDLSSFVEGVRGLRYLHPVEVELVEGEAFEERLLEQAVQERAEAETTERVLGALGLIDDDVDVAAVVESYLADAVLGFYDARTDALVVRGADTTPYVRTVLVHELTHALDDQHFELDRPALDTADDESGLAFSGLVEGNAVRVETLYRRSLDEADQEQAAEEERDFAAGIDASGVPAFVADLISFPYLAGPAFVDALVDSGGERRVDAAFGSPPTTSESVLDPEGYLAGEVVVGVPTPPAEGPVIDQGVLGEWPIVMILSAELDPGEAQDAAVGWAGDAYVAWSDGDRTCVRATFVMDEGEVDALAGAWSTWAGGHPDARVDRAGDGVTLTACG